MRTIFSKTIFFIFALSIFALSAKSVFAARYGGEFLEIGVGGRAVAMGGAVTGLINDASSFYWNPAGMGYVEGLQAFAMYADLWDGLANYSALGLALPVTGAVFSINGVRLTIPDIQEHRDYDQLLNLPADQRFVIRNGDTIYYNTVQEYLLATGAAPRGIFDDNETAIFLTFAKLNKFTLDLGWSYFQVPLEVPIGASLKILNQSIGENQNGSGIGADFGVQVRFKMSDVFYDKWRANFSYGLNIQDATRTGMNWGNNNKDAIPTNFRQGITLTQKLPGPEQTISLSYDVERRWDFSKHYGIEYQYAKTISLRGGLWDNEWTAGAGINVWRVTADYAYRSRDLGATHRVSLAFKLK